MLIVMEIVVALIVVMMRLIIERLLLVVVTKSMSLVWMPLHLHISHMRLLLPCVM